MPFTAEQRTQAIQLTGAANEATEDQLIGSLLDELRTNATEMPVLQEQAMALGRDLMEARKILPTPLHPEVAVERRQRVSDAIDGLNAKGHPKSFTDPLKTILCGTTAAPSTIYLGREDGQQDCRAMEIVKLLAGYAPPPPKGTFSASREVPPVLGANADLEKEGREEGEAFRKKQLAARGLS